MTKLALEVSGQAFVRSVSPSGRLFDAMSRSCGLSVSWPSADLSEGKASQLLQHATAATS